MKRKISVLAVVLLWYERPVKNCGGQILCLQQQLKQQTFKISTSYSGMECG